MMKSWRGSFVGSTLKGSFESSISGDKLKDHINRALQQGNAYMHAASAAGPAFFIATLRANLKCMIVLIGVAVTCVGIVKDEC